MIDFTDPYAPFFSGVFGAKDVAVTKVADLAGKTVGATRGAIEEQELTKMAPSSATIVAPRTTTQRSWRSFPARSI